MNVAVQYCIKYGSGLTISLLGSGLETWRSSRSIVKEEEEEDDDTANLIVMEIMMDDDDDGGGECDAIQEQQQQWVMAIHDCVWVGVWVACHANHVYYT